jgi:hypothetical protein
MGRRALGRLSGPAIAIAASQLGHAIVYTLRFGAGAPAAQSTGAHGYFPALSLLLTAAVGGGLVAALALLAAARAFAVVPPGWRRRSAVRVFDVLPTLFLVQLLVFATQESLETVASGGAFPSLVELLFWGAIGQLPAALLGALVISWLSSRLEEAWTLLVTAAAHYAGALTPLAPGRAPRPRPAAGLALASVSPAALRKRGPPASLLVSAC